MPDHDPKLKFSPQAAAALAQLGHTEPVELATDLDCPGGPHPFRPGKPTRVTPDQLLLACLTCGLDLIVQEAPWDEVPEPIRDLITSLKLDREDPQ